MGGWQGRNKILRDEDKYTDGGISWINVKAINWYIDIN